MILSNVSLSIIDPDYVWYFSEFLNLKMAFYIYRNRGIIDNEIFRYRGFFEFKAVQVSLDFKGQYHNTQKPLKDERVWSDAKVR